MDTKQESQPEAESWVQDSNISINGDGDDDDDDEGLCVLKREIACHSLYSFLVQSHVNCLKLCLGSNMENNAMIKQTAQVQPNQHQHANIDQSELDQFMEAYCMSLNKLREVMEEPHQESMAFINLMHSQLDGLLLDIPNSSNDSLYRDTNNNVDDGMSYVGSRES